MRDESSLPPNVSDTPTHEQCWDLLPWWVNGSLSSERTELVERHLTQCADCALEAKSLRALQCKIRESDSIMLAPQPSWQKMADRLDREEELLSGRDDSRHAAPPRAIRWQALAAVQGLAILGLVATVVWQSRSPVAGLENATALRGGLDEPNPNAPAQYATLTSAPENSTPHALRVVFRNSVPVADINALLRASSAQIISGPSEAGVYTLGVASDATGTVASSAAGASALLMKLRADERVVFVEPDGAHTQ